MSSSTASWSRYGALPTSPPAPAPAPQLKPEDVVAGGEAAPSSSSAAATAAEAGVAFFSRARAFAGAAAGRPRAWREVLDPTAFSRPESCGEARARARRNLAYFRANYALAALVLVFLASSTARSPCSCSWRSSSPGWASTSAAATGSRSCAAAATSTTASCSPCSRRPRSSPSRSPARGSTSSSPSSSPPRSSACTPRSGSTSTSTRGTRSMSPATRSRIAHTATGSLDDD